jgi:hypothetical protein
VGGGQPLVAGADITLDVDSYREMHESLVGRLAEIRGRLLGGQSRDSFDGVTEIVLGKHMLGSFGARELVGCTDLLLDPIGASSVQAYMNPLLGQSNLVAGVVDELQLSLPLPDVSLLAQDQIAECRDLMPAFRDEFLGLVRHSSTLDSANESIARITAQLSSLELEARQSAPFEGWKLGSLTIPPDALHRIFALLFAPVESKEAEVPPGMLLLRLREMSEQQS